MHNGEMSINLEKRSGYRCTLCSILSRNALIEWHIFLQYTYFHTQQRNSPPYSCTV